MFEKFESLHRNHKLAYLDGFLCGIGVVIIAQQFLNDYREMKAIDKAMLEDDNVICITTKE